MNLKWPQKIFLESTALFQLGPRLENVDYARLLELCNDLRIGLFVTELNFQEYLRFRKREVRQILSSVQATSRDLSKYEQNCAEFEPLVKQIEAFLPNIEKHFRDKFAAMGIEILPIPQLETATLVQMSIEGTPPFEPPKKHPNEKSSEKGFRDAIAMFTVLQEMQNDETTGLVVTDDELLKEGFALHAAKFGATVNCVDDIPAATKRIEKELTISYREHLRKQSEEAKAFLLAHKEVVEVKIAEVQEVETTDFGGLFGVVKDENGNTLTVERVLSLSLGGIETALWKDQDQAHSRILFRLKCEAKVVVQNSSSSIFGFIQQKYPLGKPPYRVYSQQPLETSEKIVPLWFYGQASLTKKDDAWQLDSLTIDRRLPDQEEFYELMSVGFPVKTVEG